MEMFEDLADPSLLPGSVEFFENAYSRPPPFSRLSRMRSHSQLGMVDVAVIRNQPYVAVVKNYETIVFKNLETGNVSSLTIPRWAGFENVVCTQFCYKNQHQAYHI